MLAMSLSQAYHVISISISIELHLDDIFVFYCSPDNHPESKRLQLHQRNLRAHSIAMSSISLANLPAEVRNNIYTHMLPRRIDVQIAFAISPGNTDQLRMDTTSDMAPCKECAGYARTATALIQTCSTFHDELAPLLYSMTSFIIVELSATARFIENLPTQYRHLVKELAIVHYDNCAKDHEKVEKQVLQLIVGSLTELRQLEWRGVDRTADIEEKGTEWKPAELRKMMTILESSKSLCKAFFDPLSCPCCTPVRFADEDAVATEAVCY